MSYHSEHFKRYINLEYLRNNYEEIIKTDFDFPRIFISFIKDYLYINRKEMKKLQNKYYPNHQKDEYYPLLKLIEFTEKYPEFKDLIKPYVLNYPNSVALVFSKTPRHWGLRGDPYFWTYLEESFIEHSIPMDIKYFEKMIKVKYIVISGKKIGENAYIREFAHGGMSSGCVSGIWLEYISLLKYRLLKLNNEYYLNHNEHSKIIENPEKIIKTTKKSLYEILDEYDKPYGL